LRLKSKSRESWANLVKSLFIEDAPTHQGPLPQMKENVIFILGGPGVGKGTQCSVLTSATDSTFVHLSAGDLLRAERSRPNSPYAPIINENIKQGAIVPSQITIDLLKAAMNTYNNEENSNIAFLIDGFPRNVQQGLAFEDQVEPCKALLFFDCPENVLIERLLKRSQNTGRDDDNPDSIRKRLITYQNETLPVIDHYTALGKVYKVDCSHDIETVTERVKQIIKLALQ
jgi:UMP-CMP kinase